MLAKSIVAFLQSDTPSKHHLVNMDGYDRGTGWSKRFTIDDVSADDASVFAAMATHGYFEHQWFPKWCFTVTDAFIARCPLVPYDQRKP